MKKQGTKNFRYRIRSSIFIYATMGSLLLYLLFPLAAIATTYHVASVAELNISLSGAIAGDTIIVRNGIYNTSASIGINCIGTAAKPIVVRAETIGGAEIKGTHGFSLNNGAAYVQIQGFKFTHATGHSAINNGATFCRFTRNVFQCTGSGAYLLVAGNDAQIDFNEFRDKSTIGNMIDVRGSGSQIARRVWIHHNYFHDFTDAGGNGAETIRFGLSGLSLSTGNGLIECNLFVRCNGENELISNKSSGNTYRYNTLISSPGAQLTLRHGNDCVVYGNYFRKTDGLRVFGDRHRIFSNYFEQNTKGIDMGNGDGEVADGAALTSHDRPDDCIIAFNTFITNNVHYQMGGRSGGLGASNILVANNIFVGSGNLASISTSAPYSGAWTRNIRWNNKQPGAMPVSGYVTVNPLLVPDVNGILHVGAESPAIDSSLGNYSFVKIDQDGQARDDHPDVGADEFSNATVKNYLLTTNDVGPGSIERGTQLKLAITRRGNEAELSVSGGIPYLSFVILASTDFLSPIAAWIPVTTNAFDSDGSFKITNVVSSDLKRFYRLKVR